MRLLIAEDDERLLRSLTRIFEKNNYTVDGVSNGRDALDLALTGEYDGLVLDIMMPEMDGLEVLKALRGRNVRTPALFLTARTEVYQRIEGLDAGADDYLPKPFSVDELLARVRAMLRRKDSFVPDMLEFGGMKLNLSTYQLAYEGSTQTLSGKEFQLMEMLMDRPRTVITTEMFISHAWSWESDADVSVVWVHISNIRKKLAALKAPVEIRFIRGTGYMLEKKGA